MQDLHNCCSPHWHIVLGKKYKIQKYKTMNKDTLKHTDKSVSSCSWLTKCFKMKTSRSLSLNSITPTSPKLPSRAGFSWWRAWGPAIGVGDGAQGGFCSPHYTPKKSRKIFFSGKRNVKFGHFVNFSYKNVLPPPNLTELLPYAYGLVLDYTLRLVSEA